MCATEKCQHLLCIPHDKSSLQRVKGRLTAIDWAVAKTEFETGSMLDPAGEGCLPASVIEVLSTIFELLQSNEKVQSIHSPCQSPFTNPNGVIC